MAIALYMDIRIPKPIGVYKMKAKAQPSLTPREIEVVRLLWKEFTAAEIADELGISPRTVEAHRWNICQKVRAKNTVGIIKYTLRAGIIKL
jgi:DNA-binding CsgD family transcriptional regulator